MTLGFIGAGHITCALVEGLAAADGGERVVVSPRNAANARHLAARFGATVAPDNQAVVDASAIVFLAVRPPVAREIVSALRFRPDHVVVSLIALRLEAEMRALIAPASVLVRAVPLPSAARRIGPIAYFPDHPRVREIFGRVGTPVLAADEPGFHRLWSLTGLIAPFYALMEGLAAWAAEGEVAHETAQTYVRELVHCLAVMGRDATPLDALARAAATPGGINEQALRAMLEADALAPFRAALDGVYARMSRGQG